MFVMQRPDYPLFLSKCSEITLTFDSLMPFKIHLNLTIVFSLNHFWGGAPVILKMTKKATVLRTILSSEFSVTLETLQTTFAQVMMTHQEE